jgi:membrane protease YdiL (CAAX protease family)
MQTGSSLHPRRLWTILAAVGMFLSALIVDGACSALAIRHFGPATFATMPWKVLYFGHTGMLLTSLAWIAFLSRGHFREFGFKVAAARRYIWFAFLFGVGFGIVMTIADYWRNLATKLPPEHFGLSLTNVVGLLTFEALYAGTIEEILFRGLLVTFLMQRMSGRVRLGRFDIHIAGVIVAALFCLAHLGSFWTESLAAAAGQQIYAFVWGLIYAYWYEKSGSLLPSIVGHNLGNFVEDVLAFLMAWHWV